jgi:transposase-like protein
MAIMRTPEQKMDIVRTVQTRVKAGETVTAVVKELGISASQFYDWVKGKSVGDTKVVSTPDTTTNAKRTYKRRTQAVAQPTTYVVEGTSQPLVVLMGNPSDVNAALERLARIRG